MTKLPAKSWKDVLDPKKNNQEEYLGVASVISLHALTLNYLGQGLCAWQGKYSAWFTYQCTIQNYLNFSRSHLRQYYKEEISTPNDPTILKLLAEITMTLSNTSKSLHANFCSYREGHKH